MVVKSLMMECLVAVLTPDHSYGCGTVVDGWSNLPDSELEKSSQDGCSVEHSQGDHACNLLVMIPGPLAKAMPIA